MLKIQYFWKLWDAANIITGFAATQSLAFAFLFLTGSKVGQKINSWNNLIIVSAFIVFGCIIYSLGVSRLLKRAKSLLLKGEKIELNEVDLDNIATSLTRSAAERVIAIVFFAVLDLGVLFVVFSNTYFF